jgi:hypothetical protein
MRKLLMASAAIAGLASIASPAGAGTWVAAVPVQGSTSMLVFGINNANIITGAYTDSNGVQHGFLGPFDGSNYTSFDDPGGVTEPRAINNKGFITGFDVATVTPWERFLDGTINTVTMDGNPLNQIAQGLNRYGVFAGNYTSGTSVGYLGKKAKYVSTISLAINNSGYAGRGIDAAGNVVGWYIDSNTGLQHGFQIIGGTASTIDYPGAVYTVMEGINDKGIESGQYQDSSGAIHGFIYKISNGTFTALDVPGATLTQVWGISNADVVTASSDLGSYVYCIKARTCPGAGKVRHAPPHVSHNYTPAQL